MEIILVDKPMVKDLYSVDGFSYLESNGGLKQWFEHMELMKNKGATKLYLYNIESQFVGIVHPNGIKQELMHYVRASFKT
jgi:hypothetical protein